MGKTIANAVMTNIVLQDASMMMGLQKGFSWQELVTATAVAAANSAVDTTFHVNTNKLSTLSQHPAALAADEAIDTAIDTGFQDVIEGQHITVGLMAAQMIGTTVGYEIGSLGRDLYLESRPKQELPEEARSKTIKTQEKIKAQSPHVNEKLQKNRSWQADLLTQETFDQTTGKGLELPNLDDSLDDFGSSHDISHAKTAAHVANKINSQQQQRTEAKTQTRAQRWNEEVAFGKSWENKESKIDSEHLSLGEEIAIGAGVVVAAPAIIFGAELSLDAAVVGEALVGTARALGVAAKFVRNLGVFKEAIEEEKTPPAHSLSNEETRKWYHKQLSEIPSRIDKSLSPKEQALQAYKLRNDIKMKARDLMQDREAASTLPPPSTLKEVVSGAYNDENLVGDDLWNHIYEGSQHTNQVIDELVGIQNNFLPRRINP